MTRERNLSYSTATSFQTKQDTHKGITSTANLFLSMFCFYYRTNVMLLSSSLKVRTVF